MNIISIDKALQVIVQTQMKKLLILPVLFMLGFPPISSGQVDETNIREFLANPSIASSINSLERVKEFYNLRRFRAVWTSKEKVHRFLLYIDQSDALGLSKNDYQPKLIGSLESGEWFSRNPSDSLWLEIGLTDAILHFICDVATGNAPPGLAYNGLKLSPNYSQSIKLINDALETSGWTTVLKDLEPDVPGYQNLKAWMNHFQEVVSEEGFQDAKVTSIKADSTNKPLLRRLYQLSLLDSIPERIATKTVIDKIKSAQWLFNLLPDGILRSTVLDEMNKPISYRIEELKLALNAVRWFVATTTTSTVVIVNIPSANLLVYENGKVILESRVVVGKRSTPTHTFCSRITEVILYPYWVVPKKIATTELLPLIKRNVGYLDENAMQVINLQGRVMDPDSINWNSLSTTYFPYILRQSPGCNNSLGLVKLNAYNPFNNYLHDTPWKFLFSFNKRYFSHGCIRVEKPVELARIVLEDNQQAVDTVIRKGCLENQYPIAIKASNTVPVFVIYQTAWLDSSGTVRFEEDIYQRLRHLRPVSRLANKSLVIK